MGWWRTRDGGGGGIDMSRKPGAGSDVDVWLTLMLKDIRAFAGVLTGEEQS